MMRRTVVSCKHWREMKEGVKSILENVPEVQQSNRFRQSLSSGAVSDETFKTSRTSLVEALAAPACSSYITPTSVRQVLDCALMTSLLHLESRAANTIGQGFYTIGPGGEELMGVLGLAAHESDPMALHYRHLATLIGRKLKEGQSPQDILLARARGYCVSAQDPVCGGAHCALGGGPADYIVTSTLASQTCPALGRALGGSLAQYLKVPSPFPQDFVSIVSLGDGSVNNGHYLSGENLATFAAFRNHRVPLLTCITDNGISISFKNYGYLQQVFAKKWQCKVFRAAGDDVVDLWVQSTEALEYVRKNKKPAVLLVTNITRRFGHAATDRQAAYLTTNEIKTMQSTCMLHSISHEVVRSGVSTAADILRRYDELKSWTEDAFDVAHRETKLTSRSDLLARVSAPLLPMPATSSATMNETAKMPFVVSATIGTTGAAAQVMRKHMTKVFDDAMSTQPDVVYIGEDVQHGGYYMITDGLHKKYPSRVQDFPPDETSLMGVGMGYRQAGLLPVVEIPYAKYLDCAMDMFTEACIMNWLSNGKQPNGMVIRLQGFGRGVFGGNYHTHNMLHMPPGLDVVCYSNGRDYSLGMRYALQQARGGRLSMFVDCTELLNMREVEKGVSWEMPYTPNEAFVTYDDVFMYRAARKASTLIVTYGSGVPLALQVQAAQANASNGKVEEQDVDVCDCPLLSSVPQGLKSVLSTGQYTKVLFADICKEGQHPFASHMVHLMNEGLLCGGRIGVTAPVARCATAQRTYNPLGTILTFLSKEDILNALKDF